jgi:hypothetical protein
MRLSGIPLVLRMLAADESAPDNVPLPPNWDTSGARFAPHWQTGGVLNHSALLAPSPLFETTVNSEPGRGSPSATYA